MKWLQLIGITGPSSSLRKINKRVESTGKSAGGKLRRLEEELKRLQNLQESLSQQMEIVTKAASDARAEINGLNKTIDAAHEALRVAEEITIPGLTAGNKLLIDRWEHESAVLSVRQAIKLHSDEE